MTGRPIGAAEAMLLSARHLRDLGLSLSLNTRCAYSWSRVLPFRMMLNERPQLAGVELGRLVTRLRCRETCRRSPIRVSLVHMVEQSYAAAKMNGTPAREIVLVGE